MLRTVRVGRRLNAIENKQNSCVKDIILGATDSVCFFRGIFFVRLLVFFFWFLHL
jgi:hypothetical protein